MREAEFAKELITEQICPEKEKRDYNKCKCGKIVRTGGHWKRHVINKHGYV